MKAVVYDRYGPPEALRVEEVAMPSPAAGQVLVRVAATSINLSDWETLLGTPAYSRIGGLRATAPSHPWLGHRRAGGGGRRGRDHVQAGEEVYGDNLGLKGGFAEYAVAPASALAAQAGRSHLRGGVHPFPRQAPIALQGKRRLSAAVGC